jgi:hypothetical protein
MVLQSTGMKNSKKAGFALWKSVPLCVSCVSESGSDQCDNIPVNRSVTHHEGRSNAVTENCPSFLPPAWQ